MKIVSLQSVGFGANDRDKDDEFFNQTLDRIVSDPKVKKALEMFGDEQLKKGDAK